MRQNFFDFFKVFIIDAKTALDKDCMQFEVLFFLQKIFRSPETVASTMFHAMPFERLASFAFAGNVQ
jgi:hypothetical protein